MASRIIGRGAVCALGRDARTGWNALLAGQDGLSDRIPDGGTLPVQAGWVDGLRDGYDPLRTDPTVPLGLRAAREALIDAFGSNAQGDPNLPDADRAAVVAAVSKGGVALDGALRDAVRTGRLDNNERFARWITAVPVSRFADAIAAEFGLGGIRRSPVAACATGPLFLHVADQLLDETIHPDPPPWVLVVSSESSLTSLYFAAFDALGVLAPSGQPMTPFGANRCGFRPGEGASAVVVTRSGAGRRTIAVVSSAAVGADPSHITTFRRDGQPIVDVARIALKRARLSPDDVGFINAHATATGQNDSTEASAIREVFGGSVGNIPVSATKPATGHLLGGSGLLEVVWTTFALEERLAPPTLHTDSVSDDCRGIKLTTGGAEAIDSKKAALSWNFGFGGHIGVALLVRG